ncbi:MAG: hypothetical protein ABI193_07910 [Minicystis sp.]
MPAVLLAISMPVCPRAARGSRRAPARRLSVWLRVLATLAVTLGMSFSQLAQLSHFLLVEHIVCEHGDFVHESPEEHAIERAALEKKSGLQAVSPAKFGDHEHCDQKALRLHTPEIGPSLAEATLLTLIAIPVQVAHPERRPVAPLSLAPKSSPPSA